MKHFRQPTMKHPEAKATRCSLCEGDGQIPVYHPHSGLQIGTVACIVCDGFGVEPEIDHRLVAR